MPTLGKKSLARLETCDPRLQAIVKEAIKYMDFTVLEGHRDEAAQNDVFERGLSKVRWPNSKHNSLPSKAIDLAPYPIDWKNLKRFTALAEVIENVARDKNIRIRWGADWNMNGRTDDERFLDYPHFELVD